MRGFRLNITMAPFDEHKLSILTEFLSSNPQISHATPSSPDYQRLRSSFIINDAITPPIIVRPPSATDVAALVTIMTTHSIPFTIRSGGHDLFLRSMANDAVTVDLRDIAHVHIDRESHSARIGGGILISDLAAELGKADLATAYGTIPTVGYVGWAIHGGYGPLGGLYGLGADQILGARVVNARGQLVDADRHMLMGIRGGGGTLGVIVEMTIRVYPLSKVRGTFPFPSFCKCTKPSPVVQVLGGVIMYDSRDLVSTIKQFNGAYRSLSANGLPHTLAVQQALVNSPTGKNLCLFFLWSSSDIPTGECWLNAFTSIAPLSMHTVATTTIPEWLTMAGSFTVDRRYGAMFTANLRRMTPATIDVLATHALKMPSDLATMVNLHELNGSATEGKHPDSIFAVREPHFLLEIFPAVKSLDNLAGAMKWARELHQAMLEVEPDNIVPARYPPFVAPEQMDPCRDFAGQYDTLVELKRQYDPQNVFQFALAQI